MLVLHLRWSRGMGDRVLLFVGTIVVVEWRVVVCVVVVVGWVVG
jgi:hypothetical protein